MAEQLRPSIVYQEGAANFMQGYVPHLGPEQFCPDQHTEEVDRFAATLRGQEAQVEIEQLNQQLNLMNGGQ